MSKKEAKALRNLNNKTEMQMSAESNEVYTDMVVYLRSSSLTLFQQEQIRRDLIDMILDGEQRGETIDRIFGGDYKAVCDEIIAGFPPKTLKDKILNAGSAICLCAAILLLISMAGEFVGNLIEKRDLLAYSLKLSTALQGVIIIIAAYVIVEVICRGVFKSKSKEKTIKSKVIDFLKIFFLFFILIGGMVFLFRKWDFVLFSCNLLITAAAAAVLFGLYWFLDRRTEY